MSRRLGLIIGANNYQDATFQPLYYAENDARALAQWLVNVKGGRWSPANVQLVQGSHATKELAESLITQMCLTLAEPHDLALIYFAGHAFLDEHTGDGYFALSNTQYQNPATGLHLPTLLQQIGRTQSRAVHAPHDPGPVRTGQRPFHRTDQRTGTLCLPLKHDRGTAATTARRTGTYSYDPGRGHSGGCTTSAADRAGRQSADAGRKRPI